MYGRCSCGAVRFEVTRDPIVTHACHCSWCQRETGAAFATNAVVESAEVRVLSGAPVTRTVPSASGKGQVLHCCPDCGVTLWSNYAGSGPALAFVRIGTLDAGHGLRPDVHIYTETKQPWLVIPDDAERFDGFYNPAVVWGEAGLARWTAANQA